MGESRQAASAQSPKVLIITALITSLTTVAVSFIGIVPNLRSEDRNQLAELKQQLNELKETKGIASPPAARHMTVTGTVKTADGSKPLGGFDVYLLPEGNNLLSATTDDTGRFNMQSVPEGVYSIIVRDSSNGKSGKGLLDDEGEEVQVIGARIKYRIQK